MSMFADPRARGILPVSDGEIHLVDRDMRVLASAICYGNWWGVSSHHSRIPIDRRAESANEARSLLMRTVWVFKIGVEGDEFYGFSPSGKAGVLYIRSLLDQELLDAARDDTSDAYKMIAERMGSKTNPTWITHTCAEAAYVRGVMDAQEMDWITR